MSVDARTLSSHQFKQANTPDVVTEVKKELLIYRGKALSREAIEDSLAAKFKAKRLPDFDAIDAALVRDPKVIKEPIGNLPDKYQYRWKVPIPRLSEYQGRDTKENLLLLLCECPEGVLASHIKESYNNGEKDLQQLRSEGRIVLVQNSTLPGEADDQKVVFPWKNPWDDVTFEDTDALDQISSYWFNQNDIPEEMPDIQSMLKTTTMNLTFDLDFEDLSKKGRKSTKRN